MPQYIAAIDQGTTSTRCMIFDQKGKVISLAQKEHQQIYPQPGWVEHDPIEIWARTQEVVQHAVAKAGVQAGELAAVGITNQRETAVVWDRRSGKPFYPAIVWQDTRTKAICDELAAEGGLDRFRARVGLPLSTYFSGPKIKWIRGCSVWQPGYLGNLVADRGSGWGRARDRCDQCQPHHADESSNPELGCGNPCHPGHSAGDAAAHRFLQRSADLGDDHS